MAQGAHSFGGYRENSNLVWDEGGASMWELFAEADAAWDFAMANGDTAQEAHDATVAAFNAAIASVPGTWTAAVRRRIGTTSPRAIRRRRSRPTTG